MMIPSDDGPNAEVRVSEVTVPVLLFIFWCGLGGRYHRLAPGGRRLLLGLFPSWLFVDERWRRYWGRDRYKPCG